MALSFATVNGWWYVSNFGVPWSNQFPEWHFGFTTFLLGLSVLALLRRGLVPLLRARRVPARPGTPVAANRAGAAGDCHVGACRVRGAVADPGDDRPVSGLERGAGRISRRWRARHAGWPRTCSSSRARTTGVLTPPSGRRSAMRSARRRQKASAPTVFPSDVSADEVMGGPGTATNFADTAEGRRTPRARRAPRAAPPPRRGSTAHGRDCPSVSIRPAHR